MANFKTQWSILCDTHPDPTYVAWCSAGSCRVCDKGCLSKKGSGECLGFRFGVRVEDLHGCVQPVAWDVMLHGAQCAETARLLSPLTVVTHDKFQGILLWKLTPQEKQAGLRAAICPIAYVRDVS